MKKETKTIIIAFVVFILLVGAAAAVYFSQQDKAAEGEKTITVLVKEEDTDTRSFTIKTDAVYLLDALDEIGLVEGKGSGRDFYITVVDGRKADSSKNEWWQLQKDGIMTSTGVAITPIEDGDTFEIILSTY